MKPFGIFGRGVLRDPDPAPGGGGPPPVAFDSAKFFADLDTKLNGWQKSTDKAIEKRLADWKPAGPPPKADDPPPPHSDPKPADGITDPALAAKLAALERTNKEMRQQMDENTASTKREREAALEMDRVAQVRTALAKHPLNNPDRALAMFLPDVKRGEDGQLYGGTGNIPLAQFVDDTVKVEDWMLKPVNVGGSGARPNQGGNGGNKMADLESLKPGASKEDLAAYRASILGVLQG
jgi:hypothetical protein